MIHYSKVSLDMIHYNPIHCVSLFENGCQVVLAPFVEKTATFPIQLSLHFVKNQLSMFAQVYL